MQLASKVSSSLWRKMFDLAVIMRKGLAQNKGMQPSTSQSHVTIDIAPSQE